MGIEEARGGVRTRTSWLHQTTYQLPRPVKLFIYQKIQASAELVIAGFDRISSWFRLIQIWAWTKAVEENLKQVMRSKTLM